MNHVDNANSKSGATNDTSSEDTDSSDDEHDSQSAKSREKREVAWCGEYKEHFQPRRVVVWPPPTTSSTPRRNWGNAQLGSKMQLYSKTGYHLAVYADGEVRGTKDENDLHTYLELSSAGNPGHIKIKGLLTNLYVAMDKKGRLYGEADPMDDSIVFIESFQGLYNTYLSLKYARFGWYIGIKKSGRFKRGPKTNKRQKAVKFLPRRSKFE